MNPQEKKLVIVVVALGAMLGLWWGYGSYQSKLATLDKAIVTQKNNLKKVEGERKEADEGEKEWKAAGLQTLSVDTNEATTRLRDELNELAAKSGLSGATVRIMPVRGYGKTGVRILESKVEAQGLLNEIRTFLFDIHRQPYLVRCRELSLSLAETSSGSSSRARDRSGSRQEQPGVEKMKLQVTLETLILPTNRRVPRSEIVTADLQKEKRQPVERLTLANAGDYSNSIRPELFKPYVEPPPPPRPPPPPDTKKQETQPRPVQPTPPPRPKDENMVVGRILIWPGNEQVVLENPGKSHEDKRAEIGDEVYGGTLIYIHPKGAVTEQKDGRWLFHPVSSPLKENFELTADSQPEVYHKLTKLQEWLKGITRAAG